MNAGMPDWRTRIAIEQKFLKKRIINATRQIIQGIHQPNLDIKYYTVALNSVRM